MVDVFVVLVLLVVLAVALGDWVHAVLTFRPTAADALFDPVDRAIYRLLGVDPDAPMGWRAWSRAVLATNVALGLAVLLLFFAQGALPLNPDGVPGMSWDLALHTAASFITNTNQQHYSGQAQLSYLAQLAGVAATQVVTPAVGLAVMAGMVRGLTGGDARTVTLDALGDRSLGNYYADTVRGVTRVLLPLATVLAALLVLGGVPSTLAGAVVATPLDVAAAAHQVIPVGPMAPMVAIKQLGTNGGGWYGPNSTSPLENPSGWTNVAQLVAILLVPVASALAAGRMLGPRVLRATVGVMGVTALALGGAALALESADPVVFAGLADQTPWEGKELRFGVASSALWAAFTTMTSNGSVNTMHDSLQPLTGLVPFAGMFVNAAFGGVGVGFINFAVYLLLAVFIAGLLVGRTPELGGRRLDVREVRLLAVTALVPAVLVLVPSAMTVAWGLGGTSNPGPHGLSQVLYEYASAAANNGSGFEGLGDNTPWWNVSCAVVLVLGRFLPMLLPLVVAARLSTRPAAPAGPGTLDVGSPAFAATVVAVMVTLQLLTFVPALVLGPVAEALVSVPALVGAVPAMDEATRAVDGGSDV
jgi:K+-transporting ATPase ATPase A chain